MNPEEHGSLLLELTRGLGHVGSGLAKALANATEASSRGLGVERVGIWLFDSDRTSIVCADLFRQSVAQHEKGSQLERNDYPAYFAALATERIIAAEDAISDPRTREFRHTYLPLNGIGAMLDAPIFKAGQLAGVVCHEHVGSRRTWTAEDRSFAASIGDFVGMVLAERERRETAEALEHSERRFRLLAENTTDMITELDAEGMILYASPSHHENLGYRPEAMVGTRVFDRVHPEDQASVIDSFRGGIASLHPDGALFRYRHQDGHWLWAEGRGRAYQTESGEVRAVISTRDVSARIDAEESARDLEARISQMQRLEAVGRLAGGLAHDFNNLLTAMLGHLEAVEAKHEAGASIAWELAEADSGIQRAAALTQQLMALGRSQTIDPRPTDVGKAIESLVRMVGRVLGEDVVVEIELDPHAPKVLIDPTELDRILMNLTINCRDAMPDGGHLSIHTRREYVPAGSDHEQLGGHAGHHVRIEVRDTGIGMDAETQERVFDPFFTTKTDGHGAGLGLSTVYQLVLQASGSIDLVSEPDKGTTVSIRLPAVDGEADSDAAVQEKPAPPRTEPDLDGGECILLVEDDDSVRRPLEITMMRRGYEVITACHGRDALDRLAESDGRIDLVVSDIIMPVMGGIELGEIMTDRYPSVKLLLVSGYTPPTADRGLALPGNGVLQKPFTASRLLTEVRRLLEETH